MIAILQRVSSADVVIDGKAVAKIGRGLLILLGVAEDDTENDCLLLAEKISKLRIFPDEGGKMNLSVCDVSGSAVVVPNFTLLASCRKGNRPDFFASAKPETASPLFDTFKRMLAERVGNVGSGVFGADMKVTLCNDGPVTITLDSREFRKNQP